MTPLAGLAVLVLSFYVSGAAVVPAEDKSDVVIEARLVIEEAEVRGGVLETTVEVVLAFVQKEVSTSSLEVLLLPTGQQQNPFTDIRFASEEQSHIGGYRSVTKVQGRVVATKERLHLKTSCPLQQRFPFDDRICELRFFSARQPLSSLALAWHGTNTAVILSPTITTARLSLLRADAVSCNIDSVYAIARDSLITARHACLAARLRFSVPFLPALLRCFLPPLLGPLVAWFGLFAPRHSLQLRFAILAAGAIEVMYAYFVIVFLVSRSEKLHLMASPSMDTFPVRKKSRERRERIEARKRAYGTGVKKFVANGTSADPEKGNGSCGGTAMTDSCYSTIMADTMTKISDRHSLLATRVDLIARYAVPIALLLLTSLFFLFHLVVYRKN